ncbi:MAG: cytochrome C [Bacteroidales bacterium]|nr:cytochrome C [Bacteroidales bacterium]
MRKIRYIVVLILTILSWTLVAQISPGDLVEAHAHLEGISNCTSCHVLGDKVTNDKCLACHTEIKTRVENKTGYHSSEEVKGKACAVCHNDHHGRNFEIIRFKTDTFNHQLTSFELQGKHQELKCEECHKEEFVADKELKKKKQTYLGLQSNCLNCHADYHQKTLSDDCTKCHDFKGFKPAVKFDHAKTSFVLKGKHKEVDCQKCHPKEINNALDFQKFSLEQFSKCTDCHKDVHENKFGQNCTECHSENSFKEVKKTANFNHNLTDYPLQGKHQKVDCKECHKRNLTDALAHNTCTDCHKDHHKNELDKGKKDPNCEDCHSVKGFSPSSYSIEKHNQSAFVLRGAHEATPCFSCHLKKDEWHFREIGKNCVDCHQDNHKGFIGEKFYPNQDCKICHAEKMWNEVKFDHDKTDFALKGAHQKQNCKACHYKEEQGKINQKFNVLTGNCTECHADIHQSQFEKEGKTNCERCHTFEQWKLPNFDHNKTNFPLDGAHQKVTCKQCHKTTESKVDNYIIYKIKEYKCADCHS